MATRAPLPTGARARARAAALSRSRRPDDAELVNARVYLKYTRVESVIREALASWPPLRADQRQRLAAALNPAPLAGGDDER